MYIVKIFESQTVASTHSLHFVWLIFVQVCYVRVCIFPHHLSVTKHKYIEIGLTLFSAYASANSIYFDVFNAHNDNDIINHD